MSDILEYIPCRKNDANEWVPVNEFVFRIPPEELAVAYACHCIRKHNLAEAEDNLKNYVHPEPMRFGGRTKTVEIKSAGAILKKPFLSTMKHESGTPEALAEIQNEIPQRGEWRMFNEPGLQAITSVGWLAALTKARAPEITKDTSSADYTIDLLPENLEVKDENAPSGYNSGQVALLKRAQKITTDALQKTGELHHRILDLTIVSFGELLFKTQSRLYGALPDPETEERERFEAMRAAAAAAKEDDD